MNRAVVFWCHEARYDMASIHVDCVQSEMEVKADLIAYGKLRWRRVQQIAEHFWHAWRKYYLPNETSRWRHAILFKREKLLSSQNNVTSHLPNPPITPSPPGYRCPCMATTLKSCSRATAPTRPSCRYIWPTFCISAVTFPQNRFCCVCFYYDSSSLIVDKSMCINATNFLILVIISYFFIKLINQFFESNLFFFNWIIFEIYFQLNTFILIL